MSVFPTPETFQTFCKDSNNRKTVDSIIILAMETQLINNKTEKDFLHLIRKGLEEKGLLQLSISTRALTGHVNNSINKNGMALPKLTSTMLTRLKKEPANTVHKCNSLRALCFWIGYKRPNLGISLNYEILFKFYNVATSSLAKIDHGVRIGLDNKK